LKNCEIEFGSGKELLGLCKKQNLPISKIMAQREMHIYNTTEDSLKERIQKVIEIMHSSAKSALLEPKRSMGGFIGGEASKIKQYISSTSPISGATNAKAVMYAMSVMEVNASMGLIVAAPTAGSAGILPGVLLAAQEDFDLDNEAIANALYNAAAVGYIITKNATVSGACGGCQAEVGSASAMASSALVELFGGTPEQCLTAANMALSNLLGLICDPVMGYVEEPCQKRNAIGVANAFTCADMALAGIESLLTFDEMVATMGNVGTRLHPDFRETAKGGVAKTYADRELERDVDFF